MSSDTGKKILYIEDNPVNYRLVHRLLSQAGFRIFWAEEGSAGFDLAIETSPDLILMDINLPGLSGFELTSKFRNQPEFKDTPIIAISAKTQKSDRDTALIAGCNGFIPKPIDPFSFVSQVRAYLGGRHERLDKGSEGRALRQFNVQLLEHLERQLHEAQDANQKLTDAQKELESTNKSLARLVSLGQSLLLEYDPWMLLKRVLDSLCVEVPFDSFHVYLQHSSGTYWEGLRLAGDEFVGAAVLHVGHPFVERLHGLEHRQDWIHGASLLALPIWTDGYQSDIWLNNGQPCLLVNFARHRENYIRGFWAFDRKGDRPFLHRELEIVRLYGRLAQVCLENAEMIGEMEDKSKALMANYESMERAYQDLQQAKAQLHKKDRQSVLQDIFTKIAIYLKSPVASLDQNCQAVLSAVRSDDEPTRQALSSISHFTTQVRGLFQALLRRTQQESASLPEWIDMEGFLRGEIVFMEAEGLLKSDKVTIEINLAGARVYGIYGDFSTLLRTMVLNSIPSPWAISKPRHFRAWRDGGHVCLELSDSAGAIPRQLIESAFEPFQGQREAAQDLRMPHPGLPSCRQILATYDGSLELESNEQGATIRATFVLGL